MEYGLSVAGRIVLMQGRGVCKIAKCGPTGIIFPPSGAYHLSGESRRILGRAKLARKSEITEAARTVKLART